MSSMSTTATTSAPPTIHTALNTIYTTLTATYDADQINQVFTDRVPAFVERTLRERETRRQNRIQTDTAIQATVDRLMQQHRHRFVYNPNICTYYEVGKQHMQLRVRTIDNILQELLPVIPAEMRPHRRYILRAVRGRLMQQHVFDWTPSKRCVERMTQEVKRNFGSYAEAQYLMTIVGAIVLRREEVLFGKYDVSSGDSSADATDAADPATAAVHLWHGPRVEEVVECLQRILHNHTCTFSPFWNQVKRRMHHSYQLSEVWSLYFPERPPQEEMFGVLKQSSVLFLAACCKQFREHPPLSAWMAHPTIRYNHALKDADALFVRYLAEHVVHRTTSISATGSATSTTTSSPTLGPATTSTTSTPAITPPALPTPPVPSHTTYLLFRELQHDFSDFLHTHSLPPDILPKQDLLRLTNQHFGHVLYGTRSTKRLYKGTLTVSVRDTVHDMFMRFVQDMLVVPGYVDLAATNVYDDGMESVWSHSSHPHVTARQLHNNYRIWCRHYADTLVTPAASGAVGGTETPPPLHHHHHMGMGGGGMDADHHTKHWYCSFTLFEAFLRLVSGSSAESVVLSESSSSSTSEPIIHRYWNYRIHPHKDTWKYYLDLFKRETPEQTLSQWLWGECGVVLVEEGPASIPSSSFPPLSVSSLTAPALDSQDINSIVQALQHQQHECVVSAASSLDLTTLIL